MFWAEDVTFIQRPFWCWFLRGSVESSCPILPTCLHWSSSSSHQSGLSYRVNVLKCFSSSLIQNNLERLSLASNLIKKSLSFTIGLCPWWSISLAANVDGASYSVGSKHKGFYPFSSTLTNRFAKRLFETMRSQPVLVSD